jgi:serine/threonine protein kinase
MNAQIVEFRTVDDHTEYMVEVNYADRSWKVSRRYNDFAQLHRILGRKKVAALQIQLPPKRLLGRFKSQFLSERQKQLQAYLDLVVGSPTLSMNKQLWMWLDMPDDAVVDDDFRHKRSPSQSNRSHSANLREWHDPILERSYIVGAVIGSGQYGLCRIGSHRSSPGDQVAVKTLRKPPHLTGKQLLGVSGRRAFGSSDQTSKRSQSMSDTRQETMQQEVRILTLLESHPNIAHLHSVLESEKHVHLVQELCMGGSLFDRIVKHGHFTEAEAQHVMRRLLSAVQHCHENGVCHRDLKCENVLLKSALRPQGREDGPGLLDEECANELRLIDFGLAEFTGFEKVDVPTSSAKALDMLGSIDSNNSPTREGGRRSSMSSGRRMLARVGTPYFLAPEQVTGGSDSMEGGSADGRYLPSSAGPSCDMWALGILLYMLLCGYPPFDGGDDSAVFAKIKAGRFDFAGTTWESVSAEAKALITKLLSRFPLGRPTAAQTMSHGWFERANESFANEVRDAAADRQQLCLSPAMLTSMWRFSELESLQKGVLWMVAKALVEEALQEREVSIFMTTSDDGGGDDKSAESTEKGRGSDLLPAKLPALRLVFDALVAKGQALAKQNSQRQGASYGVGRVGAAALCEALRIASNNEVPLFQVQQDAAELLVGCCPPRPQYGDVEHCDEYDDESDDDGDCDEVERTRSGGSRSRSNSAKSVSSNGSCTGVGDGSIADDSMGGGSSTNIPIELRTQACARSPKLLQRTLQPKAADAAAATDLPYRQQSKAYQQTRSPMRSLAKGFVAKIKDTAAQGGKQRDGGSTSQQVAADSTGVKPNGGKRKNRHRRRESWPPRDAESGTRTRTHTIAGTDASAGGISGFEGFESFVCFGETSQGSTFSTGNDSVGSGGDSRGISALSLSWTEFVAASLLMQQEVIDELEATTVVGDDPANLRLRGWSVCSDFDNVPSARTRARTRSDGGQYEALAGMLRAFGQKRSGRLKAIFRQLTERFHGDQVGVRDYGGDHGGGGSDNEMEKLRRSLEDEERAQELRSVPTEHLRIDARGVALLLSGGKEEGSEEDEDFTKLRRKHDHYYRAQLAEAEQVMVAAAGNAAGSLSYRQLYILLLHGAVAAALAGQEEAEGGRDHLAVPVDGSDVGGPMEQRAEGQAASIDVVGMYESAESSTSRSNSSRSDSNAGGGGSCGEDDGAGEGGPQSWGGGGSGGGASGGSGDKQEGSSGGGGGESGGAGGAGGAGGGSAGGAGGGEERHNGDGGSSQSPGQSPGGYDNKDRGSRDNIRDASASGGGAETYATPTDSGSRTVRISGGSTGQREDAEEEIQLLCPRLKDPVSSPDQHQHQHYLLRQQDYAEQGQDYPLSQHAECGRRMFREAEEKRHSDHEMGMGVEVGIKGKSHGVQSLLWRDWVEPAHHGGGEWAHADETGDEEEVSTVVRHWQLHFHRV